MTRAAVPARALLFAAALALAAAATAPHPAEAAPPGCATTAVSDLPHDTALSDEAVAQRLDFIRGRLEASRTHGQAWYWGWMTVNAGSAVGLGVLAGLSDRRANRVNYGVQAGLGALGVADLLLRPLDVRRGAAGIDRLPDGTREERIAKLRAAESRLRANADAVAARTSWVQHAGTVAINGAAGLAIAFAGKPSDGLIAFLTGVAGGELQIWTQPLQPRRDWQDYRQRFGNGADRGARLTAFLAPLADGGARAGVRWDW